MRETAYLSQDGGNCEQAFRFYEEHLGGTLGGTLAYRMLRYDVTRDGQRFLINSEPEGAPPASPSITVVLDWTKMLEK